MSISSTDRADIHLSNHIDIVPATARRTTQQDNHPAIEQNGITLNTIPLPQKRTIASGLASAMYSPNGSGIRPPAITGNRSGTLSESALTTRLFTAATQIRQLLQRQPDFQSVTAADFESALHVAFPALRLPIDLDGIYVTTYVNEIVELPGDDAVPQRRPTSSMTVRQALQNAISSGHAPQYNAQTGFFYGPGNAVNNPAETVPGMDTEADVSTFSSVLQRVADHSRAAYQKRCRDFWRQPDVTSTSRQTPQAQLVSAYQQQRLAEAKLRVADNTLSAAGEQLISRAYAAADPVSLKNSLGIFSVAIHSDTAPTAIPLAGIFVLTRSANEAPDTTPGPVLLTIPGQGLMEFSSSVQYQETLQQWFDDREQRTLLLRHVARQDRNHAEDAGNSLRHATPFQYNVINTPLAADRIQSLLEQQDLDITDAFDAARRQRCAPDALLDTVTDLGPAFDVADIQETRQQLLTGQFLKDASPQDRTQWFQELKQYQLVLQKMQASGLPLMKQYLDPAFLHRYAKAEIQQQLLDDLQLSLDPDDINITTSELVAHVPPEPLPTTMSLQTTTRTLTELTIGNTAPLDNAHRNKVTARDSDGYKVPQLTHNYLTRMVRWLDIGKHYQEMLQAHLLDSAEGLERERQYAQFLAAQLQLDARDANIRGDINDESRKWVHAALASKNVIANGQAVRAHQLQIGGHTLSGMLLFATNPPLPPPPLPQNYGAWTWRAGRANADTGTAKIVAYTPDAPDGIRLREFGCRLDMRESFINNPVMRDYLLQHVALDGRDKVRNILEQQTPRADITDSIIAGNFLAASYRSRAKQIIADADTRTISNEEVQRQVRQDQLNMALDVAGILLPAKLTVPLSLGRAFHSFVNTQEAAQRGNKEEALTGFIGAIEHLGDALADGLMARRKLSAGRRHSQTAMNAPALARSSAIDLKQQPASSSPDTGNPDTRITNHMSAPQARPQPTWRVPAGMSSVEIDGATYYYWQSANNNLAYRDLFQRDPAHPEQLKSAGYGAPDGQNVWKKISLRGGGGEQSLLSGITEVAPNRQIQRLIHRVAGPNDTIDYFSAEINNSVHRLVYSFQDNTFFDPSSRLKGRYIPRHNTMQPLNLAVRRTVSDADREASLKALGIQLKLPLDFNPAAPSNATPIPHTIHSVWVGGEIPATRLNGILANLENNATMAKSGPRPYEMKLYLSNRNAAAFEKNLQNIHRKAPTVQVVTLENTPFYRQFAQSKYFSQYLAAIDGNGGLATNYASAADVLRYRLLHHEGGLYMDCDDTLLAPPGSIDIKTTPNGLVLDEPVSNILLGMDMQYNNSIFGSQKGNPTLNAMSEKSYQRFLQAPNLYTDPRPRRFTAVQQRRKTSMENSTNEDQLRAYMRKISYISGPELFNNVIDETLPDMRQLREAVKLKEHTWNFRLPGNLRTGIAAWAESRLPLGKINVMGHANTWDETRR